ncbi:50S ribosomal protein L11 methyltransferase [Porphyromonas levii]|uniref:50S ribosomal protein L11 methyltransferase n=1 Tax=Porphyromonas levii TaxID=28114 RepID=UPI00035E2B1C|nr:50S ribosomal protein L11 methyltransferase [Porphyromonas levii]MBR8704082.1 Ribosomal protein L11 methyltransferase [Porphyromonas levii]MBR8713843.1 Ribosomal protein L11 methyltransferase [Porphyromonas levii]MBR8715829.1 Ribosomal protein L11 methyltransferase [Porphyromonas levii]MBR8728390.1 Ribosomal protein L11 methyltransferase [Porphyromonas levii]MBR8730389.1 Ribosomal protein L11 methyltransferase [Porphyromonas levii]
MKYLKISMPRPAEDWLQDILVQRLGDIGFDSFSEEDGQLLCYVPKDSYDEQALVTVLEEEEFSELDHAFTVTVEEDRNWNEEWERHYFEPVEIIEGELAVRASFHKPVEGVRHEIIIDPKMAFGTGNHATTQAMLTLLGQINLEGATVIDMGCGSGILGIYAMMRGSSKCVSIDIDEWSVANTKENAKVNGVELTVIQGDASALKKIPRSDIFLANINRNIILNDLDQYVTRMHPYGVMLLSGFLADDLPQIMDAVTKYNLSVLGHLEMPGGWVAVRVVNQNA